MFYIKKEFFYKKEIKKSKFIVLAYPFSETKELNTMLKKVRVLYPKATHYTYAYKTGDEQGSCDDSEPSGTAGVQILNNINSINLNNILIIVIRYFGGIKFGKAPLLRTYKNVSLELIKQLKLYKKKKQHIFNIIFDYQNEKIINSLLKNNTILKKEYFKSIKYEVSSNNNILSDNLIKYLINYNYMCEQEIYIEV